MSRYEMKVKEWFFDKIDNTAKSYNTFIDFARTEEGMRKVEDGFVTVLVEEKINESEKAARVRLSSGEVVGTCKGWTTWIPKSVIA